VELVAHQVQVAHQEQVVHLVQVAQVAHQEQVALLELLEQDLTLFKIRQTLEL
jgi:hypothetical protein